MLHSTVVILHEKYTMCCEHVCKQVVCLPKAVLHRTLETRLVSSGARTWYQQLPKIADNLSQQRSRRPGSVRPASVPSSFRQVISPGVASQANQAGTWPLKPGIAPPPCMYARLHTGLTCLHRGVPPAGFSHPVSGRTGREPLPHPVSTGEEGGFFLGCQCPSR